LTNPSTSPSSPVLLVASIWLVSSSLSSSLFLPHKAFAMSYAYLFKYIIIGDTGVGTWTAATSDGRRAMAPLHSLLAMLPL
jgi:hypothetical protein